MTGLIVIDESGDLGSKGTTFFAMAAIVMIRPRHLKPAYKLIHKGSFEQKWYNSSNEERTTLFQMMKTCQFNAVCSVINKNHPLSKKNLYGNPLYEMMVRQVVSDALSVLQCKDVNIYLDRSRFITEKRFIEIVAEECKKSGANLKDAGLKDSQSNPCIQLVDFIAGASHAKCEHDDKMLEILSEKISVARRY